MSTDPLDAPSPYHKPVLWDPDSPDSPPVAVPGRSVAPLPPRSGNLGTDRRAAARNRIASDRGDYTARHRAENAFLNQDLAVLRSDYERQQRYLKQDRGNLERDLTRQVKRVNDDERTVDRRYAAAAGDIARDRRFLSEQHLNTLADIGRAERNVAADRRAAERGVARSRGSFGSSKATGAVAQAASDLQDRVTRSLQELAARRRDTNLSRRQGEDRLDRAQRGLTDRRDDQRLALRRQRTDLVVSKLRGDQQLDRRADTQKAQYWRTRRDADRNRLRSQWDKNRAMLGYDRDLQDLDIADRYPSRDWAPAGRRSGSGPPPLFGIGGLELGWGD